MASKQRNGANKMQMQIAHENTILQCKNGNFTMRHNGYTWVNQGRLAHIVLRKKMFWEIPLVLFTPALCKKKRMQKKT